ncbi:chromosome partitioning protein ParA [Desulfatibacillum aliphaticivorans]|uniref:chromosome partitioning protein ParA n=1 Tax=Desulfatibacillum aliphaticivorans TaxID=218208 RepID=UPI0004020F14|nr:chromosome partitioning protein ParA [Desulfatibacillum aliphaticivorans]
MGLFGMSENELKDFAKKLDERQTSLDNLESDVASKEKNLNHEKELFGHERTAFETQRSKFLEEVEQQRNDIASENAELEKRRQEIAKEEAKAKTGFVEKQREAFKEVIESRIAELDARQQELDKAASTFVERLKEFHAEEGEVAKRELAVTEREQKANAGFADKAKTLADEASRQHKANQTEAERLKKLADTISTERKQLEEEKAQLVLREKAVIIAEQKRDAGFADERTALDAKLQDSQSRFEKEFAEKRTTLLSGLEQEIAEQKDKRLKEIVEAENVERERILTEIAKEQDEWAKRKESDREKLRAEQNELEKQKGALSALQSEQERRKVEMEQNERVLERQAQRFEQQWQKKSDELQEQLDSLLEEERESLASERKTLKGENTRLRESLHVQMELVGTLDQLKQQLGDQDPAEVLRELNSKTDEIKRLREEMVNRPTEADREKYTQMKQEAERLKARIEELMKQVESNASQIEETSELRRKNSELTADNRMLTQKADRFEGAANEAQAELERLRAAYERPAEVAARYKEIELPHIKAEKVAQPQKADIDESTWLAGVGNACDTYGLHFHPRILKAFHTALKTAEWSPLTVLAGVSGTGKSELPRLYSHFGGLMFEPLSVQPNWDSQESMLGFFNSIDNKFDAQAVLRFLAQSQITANEKYEHRVARWHEMSPEGLKLDPEEDKELIDVLKESDYPGLEDCVCLVLLDEMNLAHPELYFAEFLSKLELRRGMKGSDVPYLPVKIGAGMPAYQLPLGRNVLWTGTMNQDETTKSLSDKVLDRSIIVHFPRPTTLKRRLKLAPLDEKNRGPLLHKRSWQSWLAKETSLTEENVKPFKQFIEDMNASLSVAGRAIGHRVWQSVEYYMANYPDVRAAQASGDEGALDKALHIAFEDQLVQKVMPKLRGIDTRGKSKTECLNKISAQINTGIGGNPFNLREDFEIACELGYGQFIWQSANYLQDKEEVEVVDTPDIQPESKAVDLSQPPASYHPDEKDRDEQWSKLSNRQKRMFHSQK